ncbi:MAG: hypothetical protein M3220_17905 [Chloroflexota bacterium]|nr:hypothetical protein [Chloroflexota bacterium]
MDEHLAMDSGLAPPPEPNLLQSELWRRQAEGWLLLNATSDSAHSTPLLAHFASRLESVILTLICASIHKQRPRQASWTREEVMRKTQQKQPSIACLMTPLGAWLLPPP